MLTWATHYPVITCHHPGSAGFGKLGLLFSIYTLTQESHKGRSLCQVECTHIFLFSAEKRRCVVNENEKGKYKKSYVTHSFSVTTSHCQNILDSSHACPQ